MHAQGVGLRPEFQTNLRQWSAPILLGVWIVAAVLPFLPFALDTSPLDAVLMHVPGNQGNWWHVLVGAPFFLAYPMLGIRVRLQWLRRSISMATRSAVWTLIALSSGATVAVETPFLLHLAGTSEWQRLLVLGLGLGLIVCSFAMLLLWRDRISSDLACIAGLTAAYLANASLCLVVYSEATGSAGERVGWMVCAVLVWPMAAELVVLLGQTVRRGARGHSIRV